GKVLKGEHTQNPHVLYFQTSKLTVECEDKVTTDLDGERGAEFPLEIQVVPNQLKINTRYCHEDGFCSLREFSFHDVKKAAEQISNGMINEIKRPFKEFKIEKNSVTDMMKLATDLPRHNALNYINKGSLNTEYFKAAEKTLDNGYLYIVLSSTGSAAGELIRKVTKKEYSHASLAFDEDLETIISYNGGENIYAPGLNQEMIEFFHKKEDANIIIYKIKATKEQKKRALEEVKKINKLGSSYNLLGLFFPYSHRENIMFCSQFVYTILKAVGINYFEKKPEEVKPTDFVELDYKRNLEFHSQIFLKEYLLETT
ncbi:MAG: YiiX/YebB-like N1pC/P60 family cysteine hydrolase, partial [Bacillota bacterium]